MCNGLMIASLCAAVYVIGSGIVKIVKEIKNLITYKIGA